MWILFAQFSLFLVLEASSFGSSARNPLLESSFNVVNKDWMPFDYGEQGTEAHRAFMAISESPMIVRLTDTLHPGASFILQDVHEQILVTPTPPLDLNKRTFNPLRAYNSPAWSHGDAILFPGFHQLRIFMRESPLAQGTGAIKVEEAKLCKHSMGKFFVVENVVGWEEAGRLCEAFGMELANLYKYNEKPHTLSVLLKEAFTLVKKCNLESGFVWITGSPAHGLIEDEFPASLQAISPNEGITGSEWEMSRMPVLCQIKSRTKSLL